MKENNKIKSILSCLLLTLSFYLLSNIIDVVLTIIFGNYIGVKYEFLASPITSFMLLLLIIIVYKDIINSSEFNFKLLDLKIILKIILLGLLLRIFRDPLFMFPQLVKILEIPKINNAVSNDLLNHLIYIINLVFIIPIVEEIIFRKIMFKQLASFKPVWIILYSSLLFSLIHINPFIIPGSLITAIGAFIFGIFAGVIYFSSKNLLYVVILHSVANFISYMIKINQSIYNDIQRSLNFNLIYWLLIISSLVASVVILKFIRGKYIPR